MSLKVRVLTVFPGLVESALSEGMVRIARERGVLDLRAVDLRVHTDDVHCTTDDAPYGGGGGMVLKAEPVVRAWRSLAPGDRGQAFVMSPTGPRFDRNMAWEWSRSGAFTLVCGRYQGVDERVPALIGAREVSLGDFVLAGGELAAAVMVEATARLLPGVLGDEASRADDSFEDGLLGFPVYTRPEEFEGRSVPPVLRSGNHAQIAQWRRRQRLERTWRMRPDLLGKAGLTPAERDLIASWERSGGPAPGEPPAATSGPAGPGEEGES